MHARVMTWNRTLFRVLVLGGMLSTSFTLAAVAQPQRAPDLSPEDQAKVSDAQVKAVAASLKLDDTKANSLRTAYMAFLDNEKKNPPERAERGDWEGMRKIQEARVATLESSLKDFLDAGQATEAATVLAGRNRGWDRMALLLLGFGLDPAKESEAMAHMLAYVTSSTPTGPGRGNEADFEAMRTKMIESKKALDEKLAPLLSEEQKASWKSETDRGPRGGGGGGGGGGRGGERRGGERRGGEGRPGGGNN